MESVLFNCPEYSVVTLYLPRTQICSLQNLFLLQNKRLQKKILFHFCLSILNYISVIKILFHRHLRCCKFLYFLHFKFRSQRFPLLYNKPLLQRLLFRKNGVLFKDVSTCCDGLLSTQRLSKAFAKNKLRKQFTCKVNQSTDVKIDSIFMKTYNQFCARNLGNIEK